MRLIAAALVISPLVLQVSAQIINPYNARITVGARVRYRSLDSKSVVEGRINRLDGDMMEVSSTAGSHSAASLRELDVIEVRGKSKGLTTALGVVGLLAGSGLYLNWCFKHPNDCSEQERDDDDDGSVDVPVLLQIMAFGTGAVFSFVGYVLTPTTWQRIPVLAGTTPTPPAWELRLGFRLRR
jgi:hypothetical protein